VAEEVAAELAELAASEPPFVYPGVPVHLNRYRTLLGEAGDVGYGLIYELPHGLPRDETTDLVMGDSARGRDLLLDLSDNGMPQALIDIGFISLLDFWAPWCAALVDGEIASIAFPARLSDFGVELGLVTVEKFRGRGLGAAVTAGWSHLDELADRTLFYSTQRTNRSSQRVTERLGLRLRGASLRIA
jgi:GNAT superfamily N-acetyltransferase